MALIGMAIYRMFFAIISGENLNAILDDFMLVIIFVEVYELLSLYLKEHHVSMRRVAELGMMAIVRKLVITTDFRELGPYLLFGLAALVFALGWVYGKVGDDEPSPHLISDEHTGRLR
ncbi:hypothetical protein PYCH_03120 [Pyrococcus yayanosii CH1]|uniref:Phosphate-starvation-inducible E n=1 Tax=Pyrococcus yayanosii (strain CH1 / JCM 16557) TaxID=529709 RepID=F8AGN6_PYRYC|nr:hypothetical protein PYCH_03120 [Pyrococcus yayanosii CH1]